MEEQVAEKRLARTTPDEIPQSSAELQLRQLLEILPVAAYTCDTDGLITFYNRKAEEVWGRAPKLRDPEDRWCGSYKLRSAEEDSPIPHDQCWTARAIQTGKPYNGYEIIVERPDGQRIKALAHANPIRDERGRVIGAVNVLVEGGDRRQFEETRSRLGAIVESSDDAIIGKTLEGRIVSWNAGAERIFGYSADEAVGQPITFIIPAELQSEEAEILAKLRQGERVEHYETTRVAKDGRLLHISLSSSPIRDHTGRVIGASKVARDITAKKRDEEAMRQLHEELQEADRAKNEFLAVLAHELRNPLAPIRNTVQILHLTGTPTPELQSALGVIDRQLLHMTRLIDDLLDVSRITRDKLHLVKERVNLAEVLHAAIETSRPLLTERGHDFGVDLPPEPIFVDADLTRLAQVISNLLNNAAKYTERGGRIRLTALRQGDEAVVTVRDNGIGVAPELQGRIFEMFAQGDRSLDRSQGGLGIGLHLAARLVTMHGGSLTVHSGGTGKGSEFLIRLPVPTCPAALPRRAGQETGGLLVTRPLRILVVDDNRDSADSLGLLLGIPGNDVRIAYDGLHAIEMAREFKPEVILLDIGLPRLDGHATARRIRQEAWGKEITLVALTGWGQEEAKQRSREAGFDAHLVKPVDPTLLMRQLSVLRHSDGRAQAAGPTS
jgi:two-component system, chemotaxis family, CheB/CheR fusion protein